MPIPSIVAFLYAALVLGGGIMGYAKAKSSPSLIAGSISAILIGIAGWAMSRGLVWGLQTALIITALLTGFFFLRWERSPTRAFMPAGLMAVLSFLALQAIWLTTRGT